MNHSPYHFLRTEPFASLPHEALDRIRTSLSRKTFPAGTWVCKEQQPSNGYLYIIEKGLVEISVLTPGGVDMVVDYRSDGAFFGGTPVFTGDAYSASVRTASETTCYLIPEQTLRDIETTHPQLNHYFTRVVMSRVRKLYAEIVSEHSSSSLSHVEAFPFKKRLSEIMSSPAVVCPADASAQEAARMMIQQQVSAVLIGESEESVSGIVTEHDLVRTIVAPDDVSSSGTSVRDIMTPHPYHLTPDTYMYEAMAYMLGHRIKHLPVIHAGTAVGMVTLNDLMRYRSQKAMLLLGAIREQNSIDGLKDIKREIVKVARTLLSEMRSTPDVMEILSYIHHGIMKRAFDICLQQQIAETGPPPDIRYCFLVMGSGGRREMLLNPDQDNGFIFENFADEQQQQVDRFFVPLSDRIATAFNQIGYDYCTGQVMASNPLWRGRILDWQHRVEQWATDPEPVNIRYSSIFFDFAPLAGDAELAHDLREIVNAIITDNPAMTYQMMALDLRYKPPIGLLGRFIVEKSGPHKNELSLKNGGTVFLADCIRMFALEAGLQEIPTLKRLEKLTEMDVFAADTAEHIRASYEALNYLRLRHEIGLLESGRKPSHYIDPGTLGKSEQDLLKEAFQAVAKLQDSTKRHFSHTPF